MAIASQMTNKTIANLTVLLSLFDINSSLLAANGYAQAFSLAKPAAATRVSRR